jgi:hypothetical protein
MVLTAAPQSLMRSGIAAIVVGKQDSPLLQAQSLPALPAPSLHNAPVWHGPTHVLLSGLQYNPALHGRLRAETDGAASSL